MDNQHRRNQIFSTTTFKKSHVEIDIKNTKNEKLSGVVLVDIDDYIKLTCDLRITSSGYAILRASKYLPLHNEILGKPEPGFVIDHINGVKLDNRQSNLRILSIKDNGNNKTKNILNNTGVVGVSYRESGGYKYYRATVSDRFTIMQGAKSKTKQYSKQFNINKLGEEEAFRQALVWLKEKRKEFKYIDLTIND